MPERDRQAMAWKRSNKRRDTESPAENIEEHRYQSSFDAYIARNEGDERDALRLMIFSSIAAAGLLLLAIQSGSQAAGLMLAIPLIFFASALERWREARGGRESLRNDVIALSSVLYQDFSTIKSVLDDAMIREYLQNLLQAALGDEEFGRGYWEQAVKPFIKEGEKGFREDWHYRIDLAQLAGADVVHLPSSQDFLVDPDEFWSLGTTATFTQQVKHPQSKYYIGCNFLPQNLPDWFRSEGFFLRELVHLSSGQIGELEDLFSDSWITPDDQSKRVVWDAANTLFKCRLRIADQEVKPQAVQIGELGIRWQYAIDADLRQMLIEGTQVRVSTRTFQPRHQTYFPVNLAQPTRHPTVQFTYSQTPLAPNDISASAFFSAEKPYRQDLVDHNRAAKRIELQTLRNDWVFAGSGCIFVWRDHDSANRRDDRPLGSDRLDAEAPPKSPGAAA